MSIYSGFPTRVLEMGYNKTVYNLIFLLQIRLIRQEKGISFDNSVFTKHLAKIYRRLLQYEEHKHILPKFSFAAKDLAEYYGVSNQIDTAALTSISSNVSFSRYSNSNYAVETPTDSDSGLSFCHYLKSTARSSRERSPFLGSQSRKQSLCNKKLLASSRGSNFQAASQAPPSITHNQIVVNIGKSCNFIRRSHPNPSLDYCSQPLSTSFNCSLHKNEINKRFRFSSNIHGNNRKLRYKLHKKILNVGPSANYSNTLCYFSLLFKHLIEKNINLKLLGQLISLEQLAKLSIIVWITQSFTLLCFR